MINTTVALLEPAELAATTSGTAVDLSAWHGLVDVILTSSATGAPGDTATVTIEHSDEENTGFASAGVAFEPVDDEAGSTQLVTVNVDQLKPYVRATVTLDGDTPTVTCAVLVSGKRNYA